jgi:hypothetical protein
MWIIMYCDAVSDCGFWCGFRYVFLRNYCKGGLRDFHLEVVEISKNPCWGCRTPLTVRFALLSPPLEQVTHSAVRVIITAPNGKKVIADFSKNNRSGRPKIRDATAGKPFSAAQKLGKFLCFASRWFLQIIPLTRGVPPGLRDVPSNALQGCVAAAALVSYSRGEGLPFGAVGILPPRPISPPHRYGDPGEASNPVAQFRHGRLDGLGMRFWAARWPGGILGAIQEVGGRSAVLRIVRGRRRPLAIRGTPIGHSAATICPAIGFQHCDHKIPRVTNCCNGNHQMLKLRFPNYKTVFPKL